MRAGNRRLAAIVLLTTLTGCRSANQSGPAAVIDLPAEAIVLDNHWHTALIFEAADLPPLLRGAPVNPDDCRYVMIGWGDEGFFRAVHITPGLIAQALFYSRGSVLLAVAFDTPPEATFAPGVDIYRLPTTAAGLKRTTAAVTAAFEQADGQPRDLGPGIDGGRFFAAKGRYAFYHTCNQWAADALAAGDVSIHPALATTAGGVAFQLRQLHGVLRNGRPIPSPPQPDANALRLARGGRP